MCLVSRERLFFLNQLLNLPNNGFYVLILRKTLFLTKGFHERLIDHLEIGIFVLLDQVQDLAGIHLFILGQARLYDLQTALADSLFLSRIIRNSVIWNVRLRRGFNCWIDFGKKSLSSQRMAFYPAPLSAPEAADTIKASVIG